jgi:hypothetical protein
MFNKNSGLPDDDPLLCEAAILLIKFPSRNDLSGFKNSFELSTKRLHLYGYRIKTVTKRWLEQGITGPLGGRVVINDPIRETPTNLAIERGTSYVDD